VTAKKLVLYWISLFVNNFYSGPALFEYLQRYNTEECGIVGKNRVGLTKFEESVEPGNQAFCHTENLLTLQLKDKCDGMMLLCYPITPIEFRAQKKNV
jgi:hypothetical protein